MTMPSYWKNCIVEDEEPEPLMNKPELKLLVSKFFKREGITNLTPGYIWCPECGKDFDDSGRCLGCGARKEVMEAPFVSKWPCECCGDTLQGTRIDATGYNPLLDKILEYSICEDCAYYMEHGGLE